MSEDMKNKAIEENKNNQPKQPVQKHYNGMGITFARPAGAAFICLLYALSNPSDGRLWLFFILLFGVAICILFYNRHKNKADNDKKDEDNAEK